MKRKELEKKLREKGAFPIRQGGSHEIWQSKNGRPFTVPRHREINEWLANGILKQAEKE